MALIPHLFVGPNRSGTDWLCGDLHGEFDILQQALSDAHFNPLRDRLFLLGDVIDRGPKSWELLSWVLSTNYVHSLIGNHELLFVASSLDPSYRDRHRAIGGEWVDQLDLSECHSLATRCLREFPLTMTLDCEKEAIGLVHAQSPADDWRDVQQARFSDQFAMDCTWPWSRATGPEQVIAGVTAVVSGHIGTADVIEKGNQVWIDTLAQSGQLTVVPKEWLLDRVRGESV